MLHAVIMAGGSGTRFWPQSRRAFPKQFLRFGSDRTLLQETADRCRPFVPIERIWVATGRNHAEETARQLPELDTARVLIEPCGRNTAPCIGLAAIRLLAVDPQAVMLVMPADHWIQPPSDFQRAVERAVAVIDQSPQTLVLFGVPPTYPATGFGYIQRGAALAEASHPENSGAFRVTAFREKPDAATAATYIASGEYFWNCGIFVWRAATILKQIERHAPEIAARLERLESVLGTERWVPTLDAEFAQMPSTSIDYAVLEKASDVCVVSAPFEWDDVGSWLAWSRRMPRDADDNSVDGLFCGVKTSGCIVRSSREHLVTAFGVRDLIIVHTPTATLVADKHDEAALRQLLAELERRGLTEFL